MYKVVVYFEDSHEGVAGRGIAKHDTTGESTPQRHSALSAQHSNHIGDPFTVRFNELTFFEYLYLKLVRLQRNLGKYQSSSDVGERIAQKATIHNRPGPNYR